VSEWEERGVDPRADGNRITTNPFNATLTPGGSSGGEGALVGFRGSCLGIGTDIGGSIRSPAANNGQIYLEI
jgi:Asp-tRNA(Asn)/Glu-tRNA(Gln) amidotransferase A subunit family amidase